MKSPAIILLFLLALFMPNIDAQDSGRPDKKDKKKRGLGVFGKKKEKKKKASGSGHPFLLCTRDQFPELRKRAAKEPWKSIKDGVMKVVNNGYKPAGNLKGHAEILGYYASSCALAYILEPGKAAEHAERVRVCLQNHLPKVGWKLPAHHGTVLPLCAAFQCLLALDIVYDDLKPEQIREIEALMESLAKRPRRKHGAWVLGRAGFEGAWDVYRRIRTTPDDYYLDRYLNQLTEDGVTSRSVGYAGLRLIGGNDRVQKAAYMDVLEFTGIDNRYYSNERIKGFYRFWFGAQMTPAKLRSQFGDMSPGAYRQAGANMAGPWRVGRIDETAARYAAWLWKNRKPFPHLIHYLVMKGPIPEPLVPSSQLYMKGGAFLRERPDSGDSLHCCLWNITRGDDFHTHQEVNALSLAAYNVRLTVNGGWMGPSTRPPKMNNTLDINGKNHRKRIGAGLEEGMIGGDLEYACGLSGEALGENSFARSLILMHGDDSRRGYFVYVDEVNAKPGDKIHSYLQTKSQSKIAVDAPKMEYRARIDHHTHVKGTEMTVFYATEPASVNMASVPSGSKDRPRGNHERLEAVYDTGADGKRRIVTIVFPHDRKHQKATMARGIQASKGATSGPKKVPWYKKPKKKKSPDKDKKSETSGNFSCTNVNHGQGLTDLIYESDGRRECSNEKTSFQARVVIERRRGRSTEFYFARKALRYENGSVGFESKTPVSVYMKGDTGSITGAGGTVTFRFPGAKGVKLNGEPVTADGKKSGTVRVKVPPGRHTVQLTKSATQGGKSKKSPWPSRKK